LFREIKSSCAKITGLFLLQSTLSGKFLYQKRTIFWPTGTSGRLLNCQNSREEQGSTEIYKILIKKNGRDHSDVGFAGNGHKTAAFNARLVGVTTMSSALLLISTSKTKGQSVLCAGKRSQG